MTLHFRGGGVVVSQNDSDSDSNMRFLFRVNVSLVGSSESERATQGK